MNKLFSPTLYPLILTSSPREKERHASSRWRVPLNFNARRAERGIWRRRYWEHLIRDDANLQAHMDYIHINPVKHRLVMSVAQCPYSTFQRLVEKGVYPVDWTGGDEMALAYAD
ncbi:MAG: hypothetical protein FD165_2043 [Gammaproteobacteria bacterium]|nr:MAG: hypothetical protein FD165_2043 [Gammaproteobacteria bacterium]